MGKKPKPDKFKLSGLECDAIMALAHERFAPATWAKKFVADMHRGLTQAGARPMGPDLTGRSLWYTGDCQLTAKQRDWIYKLVWARRHTIQDAELIQYAKSQVYGKLAPLVELAGSIGVEPT